MPQVPGPESVCRWETVAIRSGVQMPTGTCCEFPCRSGRWTSKNRWREPAWRYRCPKGPSGQAGGKCLYSWCLGTASGTRLSRAPYARPTKSTRTCCMLHNKRHPFTTLSVCWRCWVDAWNHAIHMSLRAERAPGSQGCPSYVLQASTQHRRQTALHMSLRTERARCCDVRSKNWL